MGGARDCCMRRWPRRRRPTSTWTTMSPRAMCAMDGLPDGKGMADEMMSRRRRRTGLLIDARDGPKVRIRSYSPSSASDWSRVSISSRYATTADVLSGSRAQSTCRIPHRNEGQDASPHLLFHACTYFLGFRNFRIVVTSK